MPKGLTFTQQRRLAEVALVRRFSEEPSSAERVEAIHQAVADLARAGGKSHDLATTALLHTAIEMHLQSIRVAAKDLGIKPERLINALERVVKGEKLPNA